MYKEKVFCERCAESSTLVFGEKNCTAVKSVQLLYIIHMVSQVIILSCTGWLSVYCELTE